PAGAKVPIARPVLGAAPEEPQSLPRAFVRATGAGEIGPLLEVLAEDATLVVDVGSEGKRVGRICNAGRPVSGARRIAAFLAAVRRESGERRDMPVERTLNGEPAVVFVRDGRPTAAVLISVADGKIRHVFIEADAARLQHLGPLN